MINPKQFHKFVIAPTLERIHRRDRIAEALLLGTALVESNLTYLQQLGNGPAAGLYQMEPATHDDIWKNYLHFRGALTMKLEALKFPGMDDVMQLRCNLAYATAMTRIHYLRVKAPIPTTPHGMAHYHKMFYNTVEGKTNINESAEHFVKAVDIVNDSWT